MLAEEDVAEDHSFGGAATVFEKELAFALVYFELLEDITFAILLRVFLRIHDHVHSIALFFYSPSRHQIRAKGVILGQISRKVHLLPLKLLAHFLRPGKAKLTQVPPLHKVNLPVVWLVVYTVRMLLCIN